MALTLKADGLNPENLFTASWVNDFTNLLTGAMNDQAVSLNYRPGSGTTPTLALKGDGFGPLLKAYKSDNTTQAAALDTNGNLTLAGALTASGNISAAGNIASTATNAGLELGALGATNTPFLDFHSGATSTDYDQRIIASGGDGTNGHGDLNVIASNLKFNSNPVVSYLAKGAGATAGKHIWICPTGTDPTPADGLVEGDVVFTY